MIFDSAFGPYAMHKQAIEDFIILLSNQPDPNDGEVQHMCANAAGLNWRALSQDEIEYIERKVNYG